MKKLLKFTIKGCDTMKLRKALRKIADIFLGVKLSSIND